MVEGASKAANKNLEEYLTCCHLTTAYSSTTSGGSGGGAATGSSHWTKGGSVYLYMPL